MFDLPPSVRCDVRLWLRETLFSRARVDCAVPVTVWMRARVPLPTSASLWGHRDGLSFSSCCCDWPSRRIAVSLHVGCNLGCRLWQSLLGPMTKPSQFPRFLLLCSILSFSHAHATPRVTVSSRDHLSILHRRALDSPGLQLLVPMAPARRRTTKRPSTLDPHLIQ